MKYVIWVIVIAVVGFGIWKLVQTKPEANVPQAQVSDTVEDQNENKEEETAPVSKTQVDNAGVLVAFKGFGPGKVHNGSFGKVTSDLYFVGEALAGSITIDVGTLTTDTEKVTTHLNSKDFFDTAKFKTATFKITGWNAGTVTGTMTIRDITKTVSFPVVMANGAYTADYSLNMKDFGINQKFAN